MRAGRFADAVDRVSSSGRGDWRGWAVAALVAAIVLLVFAGVRHGAFLAWDDDINITENPHLRGLTGENVRWMFTDAAYMRRYVPLAWLNWAAEYEVFGLTPWSSHMGNLILHAINTALVFFLVRRVLQLAWRERAPDAEVMLLASTAGALLWAVHPLRVEVVAWASGRMYCLAGMFLFAATLAYLEAAVRPPRAPGRLAWSIFANVAFAASLLTYPLAITYIGVLLLVDVFLLGRIRLDAQTWSDARSRAAWREKIVPAAVTALVATITVVARFQAKGIWQPPPTLAEFGLFDRAMQAFYLWGHFGWKPWVPHELTPVYPTLLDFNPWSAPFVASALGVVGVTVWLVWQQKRWPGALALWLAHLVLLVPVLGLTEKPAYPSDRYSYLPGVLWSLALAGAMAWGLRRKARPFVLATAGMAVAGCTAVSIAQIGVWRDSETLFRHMYTRLREHPYRVDIAMRLGDTLRLAGRFAEAEDCYRDVLTLDRAGPRRGVACFGLAKIAQATGRGAEAIRHYEEALREAPHLAEISVGYAELLMATGRKAEGVALLRRAVEITPANVTVRHLLGFALLQSGASEEAVAQFEHAVRLNPRFAGGWANLVGALVAARRNPAALAIAEEAVRLHPKSTETRVALARALRAMGRNREARAAAEAALKLNPGDRNARELLAQTTAAGDGAP